MSEQHLVETFRLSTSMGRINSWNATRRQRKDVNATLRSLSDSVPVQFETWFESWADRFRSLDPDTHDVDLRDAYIFSRCVTSPAMVGAFLGAAVARAAIDNPETSGEVLLSLVDDQLFTRVSETAAWIAVIAFFGHRSELFDFDDAVRRFEDVSECSAPLRDTMLAARGRSNLPAPEELLDIGLSSALMVLNARLSLVSEVPSSEDLRIAFREGFVRSASGAEEFEAEFEPIFEARLHDRRLAKQLEELQD